MARRPAYPIPEYVEQALDVACLRMEYDARPWYQRNDYVAWIDQGKRTETREKRLRQMLDELRAGDTYMKMAWRGGTRG